MIGRRELLVGGICAAAALAGRSAAENLPRRLPPGGLDHLIPEQVGAWRLASRFGVVVAQDDDDRHGPYDGLLTRIYQAEHRLPVTLLLAWRATQRDDIQLHRPEGCYPAAGYSLSEREPVRVHLVGVPAIPARMILAEAPARSERLLYWTRIGDAFPDSYMAQRWIVFRENLAGRTPDGMLVRLSVPGRDRARASATFEAFLAALFGEPSPTMRKLLLGTAR